MNRIAVWGISGGAMKIWEKIPEKYIVCFIETNPQMNEYKGKKIYSPLSIKDTDYDFILVTASKTDEIMKTCYECCIDLRKVVFSNRINYYTQYDKWLFDNAPGIWEIIDRRMIRPCRTDRSDSGHVMDTMKIDDPNYEEDYFRYRTFEKIADRIIRKGIEGDVAEVGVFRGVFAALINKKFNSRKLWLFDSFDGFRPEEANYEMHLGRTSKCFVDSYRDTSINEVLDRMDYTDNVEIVQGFFPESAYHIQDVEFAFVSIDVDFEESIYKSLSWVFPKITKGGYIMLHDGDAEAIKCALRRFEDDLNSELICVPLGDHCGTIVIVKM